MARIALKIDVDTWRGTREGVPALMRILSEKALNASFLFSLGPDHTGRAVFRALRPGFLSKVSRTSVVEHYGIRTMLYGTVLPGPDIGVRERSLLRGVRDAGFEVGVHCWDHVRWQDGLLRNDGKWALAEMQRAVARFTDIFEEAPRLHGAAGWQFTADAALAEAQLGIELASDTRGAAPFVPVNDAGRVIGPPQYPTTLPTLDELIGTQGLSPGNVHRHLLEITERSDADQVYTLHAELEGMRLLHVLRSLLDGWRAQGHELVTLKQLHEDTLRRGPLPHLQIGQGSVEGRSGLLAVPAN